MTAGRKKKKELADRKNIFVFAFWNLVNIVVTSIKFKKFEIIGQENVPKNGPFLLVSNHCSRWDGLIVYRTLGRPSNFMVSPNELRGFQGTVLTSMGSFPADPRYDLVGHSLEMFKRNQGIVVFPEGNTFYDGATHTFRTGAAKIALAASKEGLDVPLLPAAIYYSPDGKTARICIGEAISLDEYLHTEETTLATILRSLSDRMHREVCFLRAGLGALVDGLAVLSASCRRDWEKLVGTRVEPAELPKVDTAAAHTSAINSPSTELVSTGFSHAVPLQRGEKRRAS